MLNCVAELERTEEIQVQRYKINNRNIVPEQGTVRASSWSYEDGDTPPYLLDNDPIKHELENIQDTVIEANDKIRQVEFLLSSLLRESEVNTNVRAGRGAVQELVASIETHIGHLETGQKTIGEVIDSLRSVVIQHSHMSPMTSGSLNVNHGVSPQHLSMHGKSVYVKYFSESNILHLQFPSLVIV